MRDLVALFAYDSRQPALVRKHYESFRRDNPGVPIVPLTLGYPCLIDGTVDVAKTPAKHFVDPLSAPTLKQRDYLAWWHNDTIYWRYLLGEPLQAKRYVFIEWDTLSHGLPLVRFMEGVFDRLLAGISPRYFCADNAGWAWWPRGIIPERDRWVGCIPTTCNLWSREAAFDVAHTDPDFLYPGLRNGFVEMRPYTVARALGYELTGMPEHRFQCGTYGDDLRFTGEPGIYHPVKTAEPFGSPVRPPLGNPGF